MMWRILAVVAFFVSASSASTQASAQTLASKQVGVSAARFVPMGRTTIAPFGYVAFCLQNPGDCRDQIDAKTSYANRFAQLTEVNMAVNAAISPAADRDSDEWTVGPATGDCEDYALTKRRELVARGWDPAALRLAFAMTSDGEGHVVLVVRTRGGDLVLDNRTAAIKLWSHTGLTLIKIQSARNGAVWRLVDASATGETGA